MSADIAYIYIVNFKESKLTVYFDSLKFTIKASIGNTSALVQSMARRRWLLW